MKSAWIVVLTASLFFFYQFIQLNLCNTLDGRLMQDFNIGAIQLSQLVSMWFYGNVCLLFFAGYLLDRYSTKTLLLLATGLSVLGTVVFAETTLYSVAALARFAIGCGAAFSFIGCIRLASRWFNTTQMATVTGVIVTFAMLGGLVAQKPFALLTEAVGHWRTAVLLDAGLGVLILIAIAWLVVDYPPQTQQQPTVDSPLNHLSLWRCLKLVALNPQNWLGGFYTTLMNIPILILGSLWGIHYLVVAKHLSANQASDATTALFIGAIIGSPLFGMLSDYISRRIFPMMLGALLALGTILLLIYAPHLSYASITLLCFLVGLTSSAQVLSYPTIAESNLSSLTSTAMSIASFIIMMSSGAIFLPLFGWLLQSHHASETMTTALMHYSANDFSIAMLMIPVAFISGLMLTQFMKETYCLSAQGN